MDDNQLTKDQHYVPRVYLHSFLADDKRFWSYSLDPMNNGRLVTIESQCQEKYLYEVRDDDGNLLAPNWLEKVLCKIEGLFAENLRALEKKAFHKENYLTKCILTSEEKAFWKAYIAIQIMRRPEVIQATNDVLTEFLGDQLSENNIHTVALTQCLPFFSEIKPEDRSAFSVFLQPLLNMSIAIGVDESGSLFTSDSPVYCYYSDRENLAEAKEYDKIILPLTPKLVMILFGGDAARHYRNNRLIPADNEDLEEIKMSIAYAAQRWIYSQKELSETDRTIIEQARREKAEDETAQRG